MKRLKAKSSEAKKQKKNQIIIGVILIIVMFGSVFGVIVGSFGKKESAKTDYNGFEFIKNNNFWILEIGDFEFVFRYNPYQVDEIPANLSFLNNYYNKPLYISSEYPEATYEIASNLEQVTLRMQNACLEEDCEEDQPTKTCEDNFIIIEEKNETSIIQDNNCVFIRGPQENLTKISDEFLFRVLGVR
jgi:hypothetical protein